MKKPKHIPLEDLFPNASKEKLVEIDRALTEHVRIALDIWDRLETDNPVKFNRLLKTLAKKRFQREAREKCHCPDHMKKLKRDYGASQVGATTPETIPVESSYK